MNGQSQYWCFTINNYTEREVGKLRDLGGGGCSYLVFGYELSESGTPHLQGYVEFGQRKRGSAVKRLLGERCHIERRMGQSSQAADYCKKDGRFEEFGTISVPVQGRRSDLSELGEMVRAGASEVDLFEASPAQFIIHRRGLAALRGLFCPPRDRSSLQVFVLWGPPGVGKSRFVRKRRPLVWSVPSMDLKWFDGYEQQESVIIDDYDGRDVSCRDFLRYVDIYAVQAPVKGGFIGWNPTEIWITSNMDPRSWHPDNEGAVMRRLTKVMHVIDPIDFDDNESVSRVTDYFS